MPKKSLLEQAKEVGRTSKIKAVYTDEHVDLALAWAKGDVSLSQVGAVLKITGTNAVYCMLALCLQRHIQSQSKFKPKPH